MTGVSSADNLLGCTSERGRGKQRDRWWDSAIGLALFCNCIYELGRFQAGGSSRLEPRPAGTCDAHHGQDAHRGYWCSLQIGTAHQSWTSSQRTRGVGWFLRLPVWGAPVLCTGSCPFPYLRRSSCLSENSNMTKLADGRYMVPTFYEQVPFSYNSMAGT